MVALSTRDTGQLAFAPPAISANFAASIAGTCARVVRWIAVIVHASFTFSRVTAASVSIAVAVNPALFNAKDSAIVKHPACAAPSSSSGFVPLPSPKRALNPYGASLKTPDWVEMLPLPSLTVPCQRADALRCMFVSRDCDTWIADTFSVSPRPTRGKAGRLGTVKPRGDRRVRGCAMRYHRPAFPRREPSMSKPKFAHFDTLTLHAG